MLKTSYLVECGVDTDRTPATMSLLRQRGVPPPVSIASLMLVRYSVKEGTSSEEEDLSEGGVGVSVIV